ncbi:MAG TPA: hypothetical protein VFM39_03365 [bacterium]|nr:hypothetical protein [bacterium]
MHSNRLLEWSRTIGNPETTPEFHCRLEGSKYLIGIGDAPRTEQGLYFVDLSKPPKEGERLYNERFSSWGYPGLETVLLDKSRTPHLLYCIDDLHSGIWNRSCNLINLRSLEITDLYSGKTNSGGKGCLTDEVESGPERAGSFELQLRDWNRDGYPDVVLTITEIECKTHKEQTFQQVFIARESGFEVKQ